MKIIGLRGPKQSGKNYIANLIESYVRHHAKIGGAKALVQQAALAEPGKRSLAEMFGLPFEKFFGTDAEKNESTGLTWEDVNKNFLVIVAPNKNPEDFITYRELTILFLNEVMKNAFGQAVWLHRLKHDIEYARLNRVDYFIITDVRFDVESKWLIEKMNGQVWLIEGRGYDPTAHHPSETEMRNSKYVTHRIKNDVYKLDHWLNLQLETLLGLPWPKGHGNSGSDPDGDESQQFIH